MSDSRIAAAKYAVQKFKRLAEAREKVAEPHVTQAELEAAKRAERNAQTFFECAMQDLCEEFPDD